MARRNRETLRKFFARGKMPTEEHFTDLIDSSLNMIDEGLAKSGDKGLSLAPLDEVGHVISIFQKIEDDEQKWSILLDKNTGNLIIQKFDNTPLLTLNQNGFVGFGVPDPQYQIHTNQMTGLYGRTGTYATGQVPGDGKWHNITEPLRGCYAFEVIAGCGKPGEGKYALIIASAIQCFGSHRRIYPMQSWYGIRCNRLRLRWNKQGDHCLLQIKTRCDYGEQTMIDFNLSSLWNKPHMTQPQPEDSENEQ